MKIYVLLASYNGTKYIRETVRTIEAQVIPVGCSLAILVSDDCSLDDTVELLQEEFPQVNVISSSKKGGAVLNFKYLIDHCPLDGDLYFFADQDDFWLPEKVQLFVSRFAEINSAKPGLLFSDLSVVDKDLNMIHPSMFLSCHHNPRPSFSQLMVQNPITGCVMAVNQAAIRMAREMDFSNVVMHDWILGLICLSQGEIEFINQPTILYRQHGNNVVGAIKRDTVGFLFKPLAMLRFLKNSAILWQQHIRQLRALEIYLRKRSLPVPVVLAAFLDSLAAGMHARLNCFVSMGIRKYGFKRNVVFFLIYVLNLFTAKANVRGGK